MKFGRSKTKHSTLAAARIALRAIRDSSDAFPPLKSAAGAMIVVWDMSEVIFFLFLLPSLHITHIKPAGHQKVKSNKKDCQLLANRAAEIVGDIWRQTKDFGVDLPVEAQQSVEEIEK
jgi:hypothetical protein